MTKPIHFPDGLHARTDAPQRERRIEAQRAFSAIASAFDIVQCGSGSCHKCGADESRFSVFDRNAIRSAPPAISGLCDSCCQWFMNNAATAAATHAASEAARKREGACIEDDDENLRSPKDA